VNFPERSEGLAESHKGGGGDLEDLADKLWRWQATRLALILLSM